MNVVEAVELGHHYDVDGGRSDTLRGLNLQIAENEFVCLLGASGSGKSTFLRILCGLLQPTSGHVLLNGQRITGPGLDRGVVFQEPALFPWLRARANVEFGLRSLGWSRPDARERARHALGIVGLADQETRFPFQLSGGMKHRVAIARAWALPDVSLLLMDEPFSALDAITRGRLQRHLIDTWIKDRRTVLYITHDIDEAVYLADRVCVLTPSPGRVGKVVNINMPHARDRKSRDFAEHTSKVSDALLDLSRSTTDEQPKVDKYV